MFKKKKNIDIMNTYDFHLKFLFEDERHLLNVKHLKSYTRQIYFKLKSLPIYPDGIEKDLAQKRIQSIQNCLQYAIDEYDQWFEEVITYIDTNIDNFEYYKGYKTGEMKSPQMSFNIIDETIERMERGYFN